ncbi:MAG: GTPase RsgA, partial [Paenibacillus sp.]|nr:GTPase RsgA [Paenibacillus sp.]
HEIRQGDDRGKHTTTHRELIVLPNGGMLIDTPGMRELQLWGTDEGLSNTFDDIATLAAQCFYNDCSHKKEPGCAVKAAVENGTLDAKRLRGYHYMGDELARLSHRMQGADTEKGKKDARRMMDKERGRSHAKHKKNNAKLEGWLKKGEY